MFGNSKFKLPGLGSHRTSRENKEDAKPTAQMTGYVTITDLKDENQSLKEQLAQLKQDIDNVKKESEEEKTGLKRKLSEKNAEIEELRKEVAKLQSVLQPLMPTSRKKLKKIAVSGVPINEAEVSKSDLPRKPKQSGVRAMIKAAILNNDFLKYLEEDQIDTIVDCMYKKEVPAGTKVITEGEMGLHLYVTEEGELQVSKKGEILRNMGRQTLFGELALLYDCERTATVQALTPARLWTIDRRIFQLIMMKTTKTKLEAYVSFLKSVPLLQTASEQNLVRIAECLEEETYEQGQYIVRQGEVGDCFFIIMDGEVRVTEKVGNRIQEKRKLNRGDYFGEKALDGQGDVRTASCIAETPIVKCLLLDRGPFMKLIGSLQEMKEALARRPGSLPRPQSEYTDEEILLKDLETIATLGVGGFGRVKLVRWKDKSFALKCLKKRHIVNTKQQKHVASEKKIMMAANSPFIIKLHRTFKDNKYVYMLMDACLGGELWSVLRDEQSFPDATARFCTACVIEALSYLHNMGIVYRDLKPENLLIDQKGYVKLCDFGFAKQIGYERKTWTFCGTPEYVAPEIILNKGHDLSTDIWSIGILMYELMTGMPPFSATDPMKTYNLILKGIDSIDFPRKIGKMAKDLIRRLCRENTAERLGNQSNGIADIRRHKWFHGFDWEGLNNMTMSPPGPLKRKINGPFDASNFDPYPDDNENPPDELSGWDADF
ncbi:cGMP-dependent protein kinase 1-like [Branchiostoma floridae x Branchiostoma belcheri]